MCWDNLIATFKRIKLYLYLTKNTKISSEWIRDLNLRGKSIQLRGNTGVHFYDFRFGSRFLGIIPKAQAKRKKKNWTAPTLKSFLLQRILLSSEKTKPQNVSRVYEVMNNPNVVQLLKWIHKM